MKAQITGCCDWTDVDCIADALREHGVTEIVEGDCKGADKLSASVALVLGIIVHAMPADWDRYGPSAGPIRNQEMLDTHPDSDIVLVFHDNLRQSKGTADMVRRCVKAGKRIVQYRHGPDGVVQEELGSKMRKLF